MCGLWGFATRSRRPSEAAAKRVLDLAAANEARGKHAWGCAWLDAEGRMQPATLPASQTSR